MRMIVMVVLMCTGIASAERLRAPDGSVMDVPSESVGFALRDGYTRLVRVKMRNEHGKRVDVDEDEVNDAIGRGYWRLTPSEVAAEEQREIDRIFGEPTPSERATSDAERTDWRRIAFAVGAAGVVAMLGFPFLRRAVRR